MALTKGQHERLRYWDFYIYWLDYQMRNWKGKRDEAE